MDQNSQNNYLNTISLYKKAVERFCIATGHFYEGKKAGEHPFLNQPCCLLRKRCQSKHFRELFFIFIILTNREKIHHV